MALWGNNDNIPSVGTVTLNWTPNADGSHTVTGSASPATVFGTVGAAKTGDVIRFGLRDGVDTAKYFGDAQIIGITSARTLTIGSTAGLANAAIAATSYYIAELPTYTVTDHQWSNTHDTVATYQYAISKEAWPGAGQIGIGSTSVAVYWKNLNLAAGGTGQDALYNNSTNIKIAGVGTATAKLSHTAGIGTDILWVNAVNGTIINHTTVDVTVGGSSAKSKVESKTVGAGASSYISIGATISSAISAGTDLVFNGDHIISLKSPLGAGISEGENLVFNRLQGGYDRQIYGISTATSAGWDDHAGKYRTSGSGWVGVTTYNDMHGNLRVKSEILVAMGGATGIVTGSNGIAYPTNAGADPS